MTDSGIEDCKDNIGYAEGSGKFIKDGIKENSRCLKGFGFAEKKIMQCIFRCLILPVFSEAT